MLKKDDNIIQISNMDNISWKIFILRGQRVMIDRDLAELYGITTKRLNEQVKRNCLRFPDEFMFQLSMVEKSELVAKCDRFSSMKHSSVLPYAFTEYGALMLASVLKSEKAIRCSILVIKAFVAVRKYLLDHEEFREILIRHDDQITELFDSVNFLLEPTRDSEFKRIGFI